MSNINPLPKSSAQVTYEADRASAKAFEEQYNISADTPRPLANPQSSSQHFIERPELPATKSDNKFLGEFFAETNYPGRRVSADAAVRQVVEVDFTQAEQETAVPVRVEHNNVA